MKCNPNSLAAWAAAVVLIGAGAAYAQDRVAQDRVAQGREIAFDRAKGNCLSCHAIPGGDLPGTIGPPLDGVKARFPNRKDLVAVIEDETKRNPQTVMPPFGRNLILDSGEIQAVVDFLYSL